MWAITELCVLFWLKSGEFRTLSVAGAVAEPVLESRQERKVVLVAGVLEVVLGNIRVESITLGSRMSDMRSMSCHDLTGPRRPVSALDPAMPRHRKYFLYNLELGESIDLEKM